MKKIFLLFLLFISLFVNAQWTSNTAVNTECFSGPTGDCLTAGTSKGGTYLAFFKQVSSPVNYEIHVQLIDSNGVAQFAADGIQASHINFSTFTQLFNCHVDANDNLIVAFNTSDAGNAVYVQKISSTGTLVWGNEVNVGNGFFAIPSTLTNGDVIVSWLDNATSKGQLMRLASTTGVPQWASPTIITPVTASDRTSAGHIVPISNSNFIVLFHDRVTSSLTSIFWAQRYDAIGNTVWASPVQLASVTTSYNRLYSPAANNDTVYLGYFGQQGGLRFDSYLQRIDPDGTIPWGINGIDFSTDATYYEQETKIAVSAATNCVWSACRYTNTGQGQSGIYVQKFNIVTGTRSLTDNAKLVYGVGSSADDYGMDGISIFGDNSPLLSFGLSSATATTESATKLDASGNFVWAGNEIALGTFSATKGRRALTYVVNNRATAVWVENKGTEDRPYAQNIRSNGTTGPVVITGIDDLITGNEPLKVFPNPAKNYFIISLTRVRTGDKIYLFNASGQLVQTENVISSNQMINVEKLPAGIYQLVFKTSNKQVVRSIKIN